jgi:hypothetical protein
MPCVKKSRATDGAAERCLRVAHKTSDPRTRVELIHLAQNRQQFANDDFELRRIVSEADELMDPKSTGNI